MTKRIPKRSTLPFPTIVGHKFMDGFISPALSCHPKQVEEFTERQHKAGTTGLRYDKKGNCHVSSRRDYVAHSRSIGLCDKEPIHPVEEYDG